MRAVFALGASAVLALGAARAGAQPAKATGTANATGWDKFEVYAGNASPRDYRRADVRAASATLQQVHEIFKRVPALAPPPAGVLVLPHGYVGEAASWSRKDFPYRQDVVPSNYLLIFLHPKPFCAHGSCRLDKGEGPTFHVFINSPADAIGNPSSFGSNRGADAVYTGPRQIGQVAGFPIYENGRVVMTKRQQPLWVPVTQEEWVRRYRKMLTEPSAAADEVIKERHRKFVAGVEQELAALSPAERSAPAYIGGAETPEHPSGLVRPTAPGAHVMVRMNKDFFDPSLSPTAVQIMVLETDLPWTDDSRELAHPGPVATDNNALFAAVRKGLDWKALSDVLR